MENLHWLHATEQAISCYQSILLLCYNTMKSRTWQTQTDSSCCVALEISISLQLPVYALHYENQQDIIFIKKNILNLPI
jgi:hypothetical protein